MIRTAARILSRSTWRGRIGVEWQAAQRDQRRDRRVDDQVRRPVGREVEILFVLVLFAEDAAAAGRRRRPPRSGRSAARQRGPELTSTRMIYSFSCPLRASDVHTCTALPHRRQLADVPRVSRDARLRPVRARRASHARGLHLRDDAAEADRRITTRATSPPRSISPVRRSAPSSPPTTRRTARRCRPTSPSRSPGSTKRAKRSACRS